MGVFGQIMRQSSAIVKYTVENCAYMRGIVSHKLAHPDAAMLVGARVLRCAMSSLPEFCSLMESMLQGKYERGVTEGGPCCQHRPSAYRSPVSVKDLDVTVKLFEPRPL